MLRTSLLVLAILGVSVGHVSAQTPTYKTKADYVFCASLAEYKEQTSILVSGDREAWTRYIMNSSCSFTKAGVRVYMENAKGLGIIKIRPAGSTVWFYTASEAVTRA